MNQEAINYFYPNGFWGGYDRFFRPPIPSRIGSVFVHNVKRALLGDKKSTVTAIQMLQATHLKNVNKAGSKPPFPQVECYPTKEAKVAIQMLSK